MPTLDKFHDLTEPGTGTAAGYRVLSAEAMGFLGETASRFNAPYHELDPAKRRAFLIDLRGRIARRRRERAAREAAREKRETRWADIAAGRRAPMAIGGAEFAAIHIGAGEAA